MPKKNKPSADPRNKQPKKKGPPYPDVTGKQRKRTGPQCTANSTTTGLRCGNAPIKGGTVCVRHGGAAPAVRAKATQRLMEMVMPALAELNKILTRKGTNDADRLRAIREVLSRTGFSETQILALTPAEDPWAALFAAQLDSDDPDSRLARERLARINGDQPTPRVLPSRPRIESDNATEVEALRQINRDDLDRSSTISNSGHDVVRGEVITGSGVGPIYPPSRNQQDRPSEFDSAPVPKEGAKNRTIRQRTLHDLGEQDD